MRMLCGTERTCAYPGVIGIISPGKKHPNTETKGREKVKVDVATLVM